MRAAGARFRALSGTRPRRLAGVNPRKLLSVRALGCTVSSRPPPRTSEPRASKQTQGEDMEATMTNEAMETTVPAAGTELPRGIGLSGRVAVSWAVGGGVALGGFLVA